MTFEQFARDMYYENRNERREYGEKLYDTFEDYFENNKSFLMDIYRKHYGGWANWKWYFPQFRP